jgi:hypothetical protein
VETSLPLPIEGTKKLLIHLILHETLMNPELLKSFSSFGAGAVFCAGVFGVKYCLFRSSFDPNISLVEVMVVSCLLGSGLAKILPSLKPDPKTVSLFSQLFVILILILTGQLSSSQGKFWRNKVISQYFRSGVRPEGRGDLDRS